MLKYGMTQFLPHHMNYVLVEAWYAITVSTGNIAKDVFARKKLLPLIPPNLTTNTQEYFASVKLSYGAKAS